MYDLTQSTAITIPVFGHDANGDAVTGMVDGGFTKRISKNGAAFGAMTVTITEMENGWYSVPLSTSHTDTTGVLTITLTNASCKQINIQMRVNARGVDDLAFPTSSGNSIDVTATGAVGIDWANVEGQATSVNLSSTTTNLVNTATTVTNDVGITATAVDNIWDEIISSGAHNTSQSAGRRLRDLAEAGVYEDAAIWIDTVNGAAGTTDYENGTALNPVSTIGDANTLATSLGISRFHVADGSSITFAAAQSNQTFIGENWTLALGGQSIVGSKFVGAKVSGIGAGTGTTQVFEGCTMNACTHRAGTYLIDCFIAGTQTIGETGDYFAAHCSSAVAGNGTPVLDVNSVANVDVSWRHYSGGLQIANAVATTTLSYESDGQLIVAATCTSLTVTIRGCSSLTDSGTTTSITDDARIAEDQNIGIDWSNVANPTTAVDLSGTDIQLVDTCTTNTDMLTAAAVNAEVVDVIRTDTLTLPGQEAPTNTPTLDEAVTWLYKMMRNKLDNDGSTIQLYDDAGTTVDAKATVSEAAGTVTRAEFVTGP